MKQWIVIAFVVSYATTNYTMEKTPILKDYNEFFLQACAQSNPKTVQKHLNRGADIQTTSDNSENCLHLVKKIKVARVLLDNINDSQENEDLLHHLLEQKNKQGKTPLALAVTELNEDIVTFLLELQANPNCVDSVDETPFHELARIKNVPKPEDDFGDVLVEGIHTGLKDNIAHYLHRAGGNVNAQNSLGQTPCHVSVTQPTWDTELLLTFLNLGANLSVTDIQNQSVFQLLCELGTNIKIANIFASAKLPPEEVKQENITLQLLSLKQVIHNATNKQVLKFVKTKKNHPKKKSRFNKLITEQPCAHILLHIITQKGNYPKLYPLCISFLVNKYHITRYKLIEAILSKLNKQKTGNSHIQSFIFDLIEYEQITQIAAWEKMIASLKEPEAKYVNYLIELLHRTITPEYYAERAGYLKEYLAKRSATKDQHHE